LICRNLRFDFGAFRQQRTISGQLSEADRLRAEQLAQGMILFLGGRAALSRRGGACFSRHAAPLLAAAARRRVSRRAAETSPCTATSLRELEADLRAGTARAQGRLRARRCRELEAPPA